MNRRGFISGLLAAAVAPSFLKGAGRQWKRTVELWVPNPDYVDAECEVLFISHINAFVQKVETPHRTPILFTLSQDGSVTQL